LEKALRIIETVPEPERVLLARNLEQTSFAYCRLLEDILRDA
jgi:hypothetical protein